MCILNVYIFCQISLQKTPYTFLSIWIWIFILPLLLNNSFSYMMDINTLIIKSIANIFSVYHYYFKLCMFFSQHKFYNVG